MKHLPTKQTHSFARILSNLSESLQLVQLSSQLVLVGDERVVIELYL